MKKVIAVLTLGVLLAGCPETEGPAEKALELPERVTDQAAAADVNNSLVRILFVGMMVFERKVVEGDLEKILVYLPDVDEHTISIHQAVSDEWKDLAIAATGQTLTFGFGNLSKSLTAPETANDLSVPPPTEREARDSRWLLRAFEIDQKHQKIDPGSAALTVALDTGVFETCRLIDDGSGHACKVTVGAAPEKTVMAESMILRQEVSPDARIQLIQSSGVKTIYPNTGATQDAYGKPYHKIYDIAILNIPEETDRYLRTSHSEYLKEMFDNPTGTWKDAIADHCRSVPQPKCLSHYRTYWPLYSGYNRPICPLIEGP